MSLLTIFYFSHFKDCIDFIILYLASLIRKEWHFLFIKFLLTNIYQIMPQQKPPRSFKKNLTENDKIVQLIKSKLTPLHQKHKLFPRIIDSLDFRNKQNMRNSTGYIYKQIPICQKHSSYDRDINRQIRNNSLFKKVKSHIEEKKKVISAQQLQNARLKMPAISLGAYIQLFSKPQQVKHSKSTLQLSKLKRESLALNIFDNLQNSMLLEKIANQSFLLSNDKGMTQEQICLMNAKFRKQLNHRKLIGIWKVRNKL